MENIYEFFFILLRAAFRPIHPSIHPTACFFRLFLLVCFVGLFVCLLVHLMRMRIIGDHSWKVWCWQVYLGKGLAWLLVMRGCSYALGAEGRLWIRHTSTVSFIVAYQYGRPDLTWHDPPAFVLGLGLGYHTSECTIYIYSFLFFSFLFCWLELKVFTRLTYSILLLIIIISVIVIIIVPGGLYALYLLNG